MFKIKKFYNQTLTKREYMYRENYFFEDLIFNCRKKQMMP